MMEYLLPEDLKPQTTQRKDSCSGTVQKARERDRQYNSMASMKQQRHEYQGYCIPPPNESSSSAVANTSASSSQPPPRDGGSLDIIQDPNYSITSKDFFKDYISKRKPCILNGLPPSSSSSQVSSLISCQDLINVAGDKVRKSFFLEHTKK